MQTAILLLNFGEPERATRDEVVPFLERIFNLNRGLEAPASAAAAQSRARALAEARAPGLIAEYEQIGGSPMLAQVREQRRALEAELRRRGHAAVVINGLQFTPPFIADAVKQARALGVSRVVGLPVYPLCGPSTTVAALQRLAAEMKGQLWSAPLFELSGWHRHEAYLRLRADAIRRLLREHGLSLQDPRTRLVFSAHGTPLQYIREGSRYQDYVMEFCAALARAVDAPGYELGYQNHTNRPIEWTQPDIGAVVAGIDAERIVVDPVSFMHEQSETLAELDHQLRAEAEGRGLGFLRVPIQHAAPAFIGVLADLCEPFLDPAAQPGSGGASVGGQPLRACQCRTGASCLNAGVLTR